VVKKSDLNAGFIYVCLYSEDCNWGKKKPIKKASGNLNGMQVEAILVLFRMLHH
jgi:hypothetical protein